MTLFRFPILLLLCGYLLGGAAEPTAADIAGAALGSRKAAEQYAERLLFRSHQGHGFAAEHVNNFVENHMSDHTSAVVGGNNERNGPDRIRTGSQFRGGAQRVQVKYWKTGLLSVVDCFDPKTGLFMYLNEDGTPMVIEVAKDNYEAAVAAMKTRIMQGKVPGVTDVAAAEKLNSRGHITYLQARNIARFGTVDGLFFDAQTGAVTSLASGGISMFLTFAGDIWKGEDFDKASGNAFRAGGRSLSTSIFTHVLSSQVARSRIELLLRPMTDSVVKKLGAATAATMASTVSGKTIHGAAAMSHISKLMRGTIVTNTISTTIMSLWDVKQYYNSEIGGGQAIKNIGKTGTGVAAGGAGWTAGAALGATVGSVVPGLGTVVGSVVGGVVGSVVSGQLGSHVADVTQTKVFRIKDDNAVMMDYIHQVIEDLANNYLLTEAEFDILMDHLKGDILESIMSEMKKARKVTKMGDTALSQTARLHIEPILESIREKNLVKRSLPESEPADGTKTGLVLESASEREDYYPKGQTGRALGDAFENLFT
ncbi:uncharacterized protein EV422DRAFT_564093 [Fimicolochytrium jonesii]|uniref:uncharacterized protein n=1 Tax=Fimicolochytrium jonesii TaxID=1396493 RepID=UPI0022FDF10A|nr:uncharacterized protein EV422DRAFT_564093 [Fimicolochytrium jonesii]KAI8826291.1 hypothetical protein EV422DRAFT_564093 [Fimicolochytrium jonesii]